MKKKIIIGVIIVAIVALITIIFLMMKNSDNYIKQKADKIFGSNYCPRNSFRYSDNEHLAIAGQAMTPYKCKLCNKKYVHTNTAIPKICSSCATITGRCMVCGKLENNNV